MLTPQKQMLSPHKQPSFLQQSPNKWKMQGKSSKPQVACALFMDWNDEQVKRTSNTPSKDKQGVKGAQQHDTPKRPLRFHEWKQQKQQQSTVPKPTSAAPTLLTAASTAAAVGLVAVADEAQASGGAPVEAAMESEAIPVQADIMEPLAHLGNSLELQNTDWMEPVPYMSGIPEKATEGLSVSVVAQGPPSNSVLEESAATLGEPAGAHGSALGEATNTLLQPGSTPAATAQLNLPAALGEGSTGAGGHVSVLGELSHVLLGPSNSTSAPGPADAAVDVGVAVKGAESGGDVVCGNWAPPGATAPTAAAAAGYALPTARELSSAVAEGNGAGAAINAPLDTLNGAVAVDLGGVAGGAGGMGWEGSLRAVNAASAGVSGEGEVRRSVLGPLEHAIGRAMEEAWQSTSGQLAAAIERQLPDVESIPGGLQLQEVLTGMKQVGGALSSSMSSAWSTHPTLSRLLAYIAAGFGLLLLVRSPSPKRKETKQGPPAMKELTPQSRGSTRPGDGKDVSAGGQQRSGVGRKGLWGGGGGALSGAASALLGEWQGAGQPLQLQPMQKQQLQHFLRPLQRLQQPVQEQRLEDQASQEQLLREQRPQEQRLQEQPPLLLAETSSENRKGSAEKAFVDQRSYAGSQQGAGDEVQSPEKLRQRIRVLLQQAAHEQGPLAALMPSTEDPLHRELDALLQQLELAAGDEKGRPKDVPALLPAPGGDGRRNSSESTNSSTNTPRGPKWDGDGLGVAQWDSWERKSGTREWDSRTPIGSKPPPPDPRLLGAWQLEYVSLQQLQQESALLPLPSATSTLALLMQLVRIIPGFSIVGGIVQHLWEDPSNSSGILNMTSTAVFRLGPLGSLRLSARGGWREDLRSGRQEGGHKSIAWFETLGVQPISLLGFSPDEGMLPEVVVPLPSNFQEPTDWCTTYLDAESRITRGESGAYLFRKLPPISGGILANNLSWDTL